MVFQGPDGLLSSYGRLRVCYAQGVTATDCARDWGALRRVPSVLEAYPTENHLGGGRGNLAAVWTWCAGERARKSCPNPTLCPSLPAGKQAVCLNQYNTGTAKRSLYLLFFSTRAPPFPNRIREQAARPRGHATCPLPSQQHCSGAIKYQEIVVMAQKPRNYTILCLIYLLGS